MTAQVLAITDKLRDRAAALGRTARFMEVCGTHTVSFFRHGLRAMIPKNVRLISGPGCPVCVTAQRHIDAAIELSREPGVIITTYGDMLRVPGRLGSLEESRALGADVRIVTSARTSLDIAIANPHANVVFLAVGFETTAPATAATIIEASRRGIGNFHALAFHKLVVPAMMALLESDGTSLDGFLCPGHVSVIIGASAYAPVVEQYHKPCVVAGFEPAQMLGGLSHLISQVQRGEARLENIYRGVVDMHGNRVAQQLLAEVFTIADAPWRALGDIPDSGLALSQKYEEFDAVTRFGLTIGEDEDNPACRCGEVIQGKVEPVDCPLFGHACTPQSPIGPCMVSGEGTCAAWYKYNRQAAHRTSIRMEGVS